MTDITLKIASASCNQTGGDWPRNLENICDAIDRAAEDGADLLCLEELGLCGYDRGDDFYYSDNAQTREMLQIIANYAKQKSPNLVLSVGHPWFFADKNLADQDDRRKNSLFNRENRNFNVQSFIANGEIVSMSTKRYLFNYARGYEKRHFVEGSDRDCNEYPGGRDGCIPMELPEVEYRDGTRLAAKVIPFGSPVIQIGEGEEKANLTHVICEEYWIGSKHDESPDDSDYDRDNPLAQKARNFDISVAVNPNASPPAANKIEAHYHLSKLATRHARVLVHTDGVGSSGSTYAQGGSRLMAQDGKIISEGKRVTLANVNYTSKVVTLQSAVDKGHAPHAVVEHTFSRAHVSEMQDGPAAWENNGRREFEEELRTEILWLRDYMAKNRLQGITQALSGGADSSYNAVKVRLMVELSCHELGVEGFLASMPHLKYADKIRAAYQKHGTIEAAVDETMQHMLTCVYMGTDNSSEATLNAARTMVEGSTDSAAKSFKGIGGKFETRNVQRLIELYAEVYSGVNPATLDVERDTEIRTELARLLQLKPGTPKEELDKQIAEFKQTYEEVVGDVLSVANPAHTAAYENLQARLRMVLIMMYTNVEGKIAIANPNLDEARNSYTTWGGDMHSGMISGNAHKDKQRQLDHMQLLYDYGLDGLGPVKAFHYVLKNKPSAELLPKDASGKVTQTDEDSLGRSFRQMNVISHYMLLERPIDRVQPSRKNSPTEVLEKCLAHPYFEQDDIETVFDRVQVSYAKWHTTHFKNHGAPLAMTYGPNVDKHVSFRSSNTSAQQRPELAVMAIDGICLLAQRDGRSFEELSGGLSYRELRDRARYDTKFIKAIDDTLWKSGTTDGRPWKLNKLYAHVKDKGFDSLLSKTRMAEIMETAGFAASR